MHILPIDASPMQLRKLRNGHNVRIKKGTGFNLIVHPENYHLASKAFAKNKGIEVKSVWTLKKNNVFLKQKAFKEHGYNCELWIINDKGELLEIIY